MLWHRGKPVSQPTSQCVVINSVKEVLAKTNTRARSTVLSVLLAWVLLWLLYQVPTNRPRPPVTDDVGRVI